jgi:hypothetical protein
MVADLWELNDMNRLLITRYQEYEDKEAEVDEVAQRQQDEVAQREAYEAYRPSRQDARPAHCIT